VRENPTGFCGVFVPFSPFPQINLGVIHRQRLTALEATRLLFPFLNHLNLFNLFKIEVQDKRHEASQQKIREDGRETSQTTKGTLEE
jgi:hypothetical protein